MSIGEWRILLKEDKVTLMHRPGGLRQRAADVIFSHLQTVICTKEFHKFSLSAKAIFFLSNHFTFTPY
jgi:hypothetical protein